MMSFKAILAIWLLAVSGLAAAAQQSTRRVANQVGSRFCLCSDIATGS